MALRPWQVPDLVPIFGGLKLVGILADMRGSRRDQLARHLVRLGEGEERGRTELDRFVLGRENQDP